MRNKKLLSNFSSPSYWSTASDRIRRSCWHTIPLSGKVLLQVIIKPELKEWISRFPEYRNRCPWPTQCWDRFPSASCSPCWLSWTFSTSKIRTPFPTITISFILPWMWTGNMYHTKVFLWARITRLHSSFDTALSSKHRASATKILDSRRLTICI